MSKKVLASLTTVLMCICLMCPFVYAANTSTITDYATEGFDTLSFSQSEYSAPAIKVRQTDENYLEHLIIGFLASTKASIREPSMYDNQTAFISSTATMNNTVQYRLTEAKYTAALYNELGWQIIKDNISFDQFVANIKENSATATIVEDYTYTITDGFSSESFRRREYTFELIKEDDTWQIVGVTTNDPWELDSSFEYAAIDIDAAIQRMREDNISPTSSATSTSSDTGTPRTETASSSLNRWTYSSAKAVAYAVEHYADTSNPVFGFTPGNDCQNFCSQCIWAGLGGNGTSTSSRPAVSTSLAGTAGSNVWQRNIATECYPSNTYWLNWTWDNVRGFAHMMTQSSSNKEGPYGNTQYSTGYLCYSFAGNILSVDWDGAPARDTLDHAMFVTEVTGELGERTPSNIKIAAHTSATNSAYQALTSYTSMPSSAFARIVVNYGHYSTEQP